MCAKNVLPVEPLELDDSLIDSASIEIPINLKASSHTPGGEKTTSFSGKATGTMTVNGVQLSQIPQAKPGTMLSYYGMLVEFTVALPTLPPDGSDFPPKRISRFVRETSHDMGWSDVAFQEFKVTVEPGQQFADYQGSDSTEEVSHTWDNLAIQNVLPSNDASVPWFNPETTQGSRDYSTQITRSIDGNIGFFGSAPQFSVGGGVSVSSGQSYSVPDISVINNTSGSLASYTFDLARGCAASKSTFQFAVHQYHRIPDNKAGLRSNDAKDALTAALVLFKVSVSMKLSATWKVRYQLGEEKVIEIPVVCTGTHTRIVAFRAPPVPPKE